MESIVIQYPGWSILLCVALGALYAVFHYFRNSEFDNPTYLSTILALLRGTAVSLIALLLLDPVVRSIHENIKKPIVIVGLDQSLSVADALKKDSRTKLLGGLNDLKDNLSGSSDVVFYKIGTQTELGLDTSFNANRTNLADFFNNIEDNYSHLNVQGIVLASDGIYNVGQNPLYTQTRLSAPLHTLRLGDTTVSTDINIRNVFHNEIVFLNDRFEVEADIDASGLKGQSATLTLQQYQGNVFKNVTERRINISDEDHFSTERFELPANQAGVQRYRLSINKMVGEDNVRNNVRDFFVEVLDSRIKIALFRDAPHPDITALKTLISESENYELDVLDLNKDLNKLQEYDLVVLHNLPSARHDLSNLKSRLDQLKMPRLFVLGSTTNAGRFNQVQNSVQISGASSGMNNVQPLIDQQFPLFKVDEDLGSKLSDFPPLITPFGEYKSINGSKVLARQKIGSVSTDYPLIVCNEFRGIKEGVILGEGMWRWRLVDFVRFGNHESVDGIFKSIVQYLSVKENKEKFRVRANKNLFEQGENIHFTAELYNSSYEAITDPEVYLTVYSAEGDEFRYTFSRADKKYDLDLGQLKEGSYRYTARTTLEGKELTKTGTFAVRAIELEYYNTVADHDLLKNLSEKWGGKSYAFEQLDLLISDLENQELQPVVAFANRTTSAMHFKWIFALIALLLTAEWFLRRYYGRY